jgi:diguanylate cyclase (GGDEF)-like protein
MRREHSAEPRPSPETRNELREWIRNHAHLSPSHRGPFLEVIDAVFDRHEHLWQESKREAIHALSVGFSDKIARMNAEIAAKDATVSSISTYFERLVKDLTEQTHRDSKTQLMNFEHFIDRLRSFLSFEQRGRWCAVGLVDIRSFKQYNDMFGHALGDRIIERVARLLRDQVRPDDLLAQDRTNTAANLHARFGGDEFCFVISDLLDDAQAAAIAERFRASVEHDDWVQLDPRLGERPIRVDVGVACLALDRVAERRFVALQLATSLIDRADALMYVAKGQGASSINIARVRLVDGQLVDMTETGDPSTAATR